MYFSENLTKLRKGRGWSQEDLADKLDISRQAVSKWEVGSSKPDIDNLMKLSKLFSKSIDELVNNQIVKTEAMSVVVKKRDFKQDILLWLRGLIILLIVFLIINTIYKFTMLFMIIMGEQKYQQLDNYHYVVTKYDDEGIKEKEECWYKEGVSKTINSTYIDGNPEETITYLDKKNNTGYIEFPEYNVKQPIDMEKEFEVYEERMDGRAVFANIPNEIKKMDLWYIISKVLTVNEIKLINRNNPIFLTIGNQHITLKQDTLLPESNVYIENNEDKFEIISYIIELNSVEEIKI